MMNRTKEYANYRQVVVQIFVCIVVAAATLYAYIENQNELTELRLAIPTLAKEVRQLNEENIRLKYEINQFESPIHLMELLRKPEFAHLKYPYDKDVLMIPEEVPAVQKPLPIASERDK